MFSRSFEMPIFFTIFLGKSGNTYHEVEQQLEQMQDAVDKESRVTATALLKEYRLLRKFQKEDDLKGIYKTLIVAQKLLKKFPRKLKNQALADTLASMANQDADLLDDLKDTVTNDDKMDFYKHLDRYFASIADQFRDVIKSGEIKIADN